ncbi:MAG: hypothetical protein EZS28_010639 [Streblomastix strix]|uniref:Uncharacterized protein n=1 Tax=Streblomastix strix TaxID=222440 RepID=A0A5J4WFT3_9EUKA|nr:MAG: hypothetical protein EZS28_010639 [Streblomastix strix]
MKSPTIPEVEPQFEKEIDRFQQLFQQPFQQQVIICETPKLSARRRSSIFEETLTPGPSVRRWLLDIISEGEHMVKESAHFVLSENQLIWVVAYTFDVPESQIQLCIEDEGCCGRFRNDSTQTINKILIGNALYGSSKYNTIGLINEVKNIENLINIINEAHDPYNREEIDEILDKKLNNSEQIDAYTKQEDDALLLLKADNSELIDAYSKTEADALFEEKLNITDQIDAYNKTEVDALLDDKLNISDQLDAYIKQEDDALLLLKAEKSELIDAYSKTEDDALLLLKTDKTELIGAYSKTEADALLDDKLNISDQIDAYSKTENDALLLMKADKTELIDAYNKQEHDKMLALKLNISDQIDAYNKTEADALLQLKAYKPQLIDAYNKTEVDALLDDKLNISDQIDAYTKYEDDALLLLNVDKSELADYVNLGTAQTISGQKQINIITVASVLKQGKNDAFMHLAGGCNMLVSSLVNQNELQEVRDIASGKSKTYVLDIQSDLNDWIAIQDNIAKLAIGNNLYIVDKQVVDFWQDGTEIKVLETEQPDMTNVITTLGTAICGDNAINDLLFSVNTLIPAKNINFVTADYDQNISGSKTFTSTIHFVGIQVQNYDNAFVVLAGGGVRAIQDINASVDLSNYYNKLQTYSQTEMDQKLNLKLNISDQIDAYTKGQNDALLLLEAVKAEIIDAQNKTEVDTLHDNKLDVSDQIDAYTKTQDDALLLLKADKTQLIDTYIKQKQIICQIIKQIQEFHILKKKMMRCCC